MANGIAEDGGRLVRPTMAAYDDVTATAVEIVVADGVVPAWLHRPDRPDRDEPGPAIAIGAEAYGPNDFTRQVASTLAHLGYVTIVPDYYRGQGPRDPENYDDFTEVIEHIGTLDFVRATRDVMASVDHLRTLPEVDPSKVAVWGYCTGATLALLTACLDRTIAASVLFFPSQPKFEQLDDRHPAHPMDLLWTIAAPTLILYGDQDVVMPADLLTELQRRLARWRVEHTVEIFPGAGHAFTAPTPSMYNETADRASWADAVRFVDRHLLAP